MDFHECDIKTKDNEGKYWEAGLRPSLKGFVHQRLYYQESEKTTHRTGKCVYFLCIIIIILCVILLCVIMYHSV